MDIYQGETLNMKFPLPALEEGGGGGIIPMSTIRLGERSVAAGYGRPGEAIIEKTPRLGFGEVVFSLTPEETKDLIGRYEVEVKLKETNGEIKVLKREKFNVKRSLIPEFSSGISSPVEGEENEPPSNTFVPMKIKGIDRDQTYFYLPYRVINYYTGQDIIEVFINREGSLPNIIHFTVGPSDGSWNWPGWRIARKVYAWRRFDGEPINDVDEVQILVPIYFSDDQFNEFYFDTSEFDPVQDVTIPLYQE